MKKMKIYEALSNNDLTEGRGQTIVVASFAVGEDCLRVVEDPRYSRWCVMGVHNRGSAHYNMREREFVVYDSSKEFWDIHDKVIIRERALAKLTKQEREALGV